MMAIEAFDFYPRPPHCRGEREPNPLCLAIKTSIWAWQSGFQITSLIPLILDECKLRKRLTSAELSKKSISGVYIYIGPLKTPKKAGFMKESGCHCNRFFVTVTACLLLLMNRGFQKLSL